MKKNREKKIRLVKLITASVLILSMVFGLPFSGHSLLSSQAGASETSADEPGTTLTEAPTEQAQTETQEDSHIPSPPDREETETPPAPSEEPVTESEEVTETGSQPQPAPKPRAEDGPIMPMAYQNGNIKIGDVVYECKSNGEAYLINGKDARGHFEVPSTIVGLGGETYRVTKIHYYVIQGVTQPAFLNGKITGLSFEEPSNVKEIFLRAFEGCDGLAGTEIKIPKSVTNMGRDAFLLGSGKYARMEHEHVAKIDGDILPDLKDGEPLTLPEAAKDYESKVDSKVDNVTLHKGAKWTNDNLTEAQIRIDYGKHPNYSGNIDFVFVLDHSSSMLQVTTTTVDGVEYTLPRTFFTNDLLLSISEKILDEEIEGYDNRVGIVAFGEQADYLWKLDFTKDTGAIEEALFNNPVSSQEFTNYDAGLNNALNFIDSGSDSSRQKVVVFLSDGKSNRGDGTGPAATLRSRGINVYPLAIYLDSSDRAEAIPKLKAISFNRTTVYDARDTDEFRTAIKQIINTSIKQEVPLSIKITDVLSQHFDLQGTVSDIVVPPGSGSATVSGDTIEWDTSGSSSAVVHHILINVKLKENTELTARGELVTNNSMVAGDITTSSQPILIRYLVHHEFVNGSQPGQPLPAEVTNLLTRMPATKGGFRDGATVTPTPPPQLEVTTGAGEKWEFVSWDTSQSIIDEDDHTFVGTWRKASLDFDFTKTDGAGQALTGAAFDLYKWKGSSAPTEAESYITAAAIGSEKWERIGAAQAKAGGVYTLVIQEAGTYQLVETAAPPGCFLPESQWRFTVADGFAMSDFTTIKQSAGTNKATDFVKTGSPGAEKWELPNIRITKVIVKKEIGNFSGQTDDARTELARRRFAIQLSGAANGKVMLKHNETSGEMTAVVGVAGSAIQIAETVPIDFADSYTVAAAITHADGTTDTQNGRTIIVQPGDTVVITVTNTFTPASFFRDWNTVNNIFQG